jgi:hypothetical protein
LSSVRIFPDFFILWNQSTTFRQSFRQDKSNDNQSSIFFPERDIGKFGRLVEKSLPQLKATGESGLDPDILFCLSDTQCVSRLIAQGDPVDHSRRLRVEEFPEHGRNLFLKTDL